MRIRIPLALFMSLLSTTISMAQNAALQKVIDGIRYNDQLASSLDLGYEIKSIVVKGAPYLSPGNNETNRTQKGRLQWVPGKYKHVYQGVASHPQTLDKTESRYKPLVHEVEGIDMKWVMEPEPNEYRYAFTRSWDEKVAMEFQHTRSEAIIRPSPRGRVQNPLSKGVKVARSDKSDGLLDFDLIDWQDVAADSVDGVACQKIEGVHRHDKDKTRLWVDPARGYRMMKMERESLIGEDLGEGRFRGCIAMGVFQTKEMTEAKPGIWISTRIESAAYWIDTSGTKTLLDKTETIVKILGVNEPIADEVFHPGIPNGYHVMDMVLGNHYSVGRDFSGNDFKEQALELKAAVKGAEPSPVPIRTPRTPEKAATPSSAQVKPVSAPPSAAGSARGTKDLTFVYFALGLVGGLAIVGAVMYRKRGR